MALKPCPFCGSYAVEIVALTKRTKHFGECVCCYECGAEVAFPPPFFSSVYATERKWNERADSPTPKMYGIDEAVTQAAVQIAREYAKEEIEKKIKAGRKLRENDADE